MISQDYVLHENKEKMKTYQSYIVNFFFQNASGPGLTLNSCEQLHCVKLTIWLIVIQILNSYSE